MIYNALHNEAFALLRRMTMIPSPSRSEADVADMLEDYLRAKGLAPRRFGNNLAVMPQNLNHALPTLMLNSHIDTVKPSPSYTYDPYNAPEADDRINGLGSNDAGASVVSLISAFLALQGHELGVNLLLALSAEEEVGGEGGMRLLLPSLKEAGVKIDMALVGEPTSLQPAVAERGLVVLDCVTAGVAGHAARDEGVNAIYRAIDDIAALRGFCFPRESEVLGPVKVSVTMIEAGRQHNVVPDECRWVADVRTTDAFSNEETVRLLLTALSPWTTATPRSTRVHASVIAESHPMALCARSLGRMPFVSPTTSDMSLMYDFPSLKIGPGESARSHRADEYVLRQEVADGIDFYISFLTNLKHHLK